MLKDLLTTGRTCRTFDEYRRVTREELTDMIDCARITPSTMNLQPLCYRIVCDAEELSLVQPLTKWGGALPELHLPPVGHRPTAFIIVCQDTEAFGAPGKFDRDVGICALAIQLRAVEMGLAACIIGSVDKAGVKEALKLPEAVVPLLAIGIGKPDEERRMVKITDGSIKYYREDGVHMVPKRELSDIII